MGTGNIINNLKIHCDIMCSTWIFSPKICYPPASRICFIRVFIVIFIPLYLHSPKEPPPSPVSKYLYKSVSLPLFESHSQRTVNYFVFWLLDAMESLYAKLRERAPIKYLGIHMQGRYHSLEGIKEGTMDNVWSWLPAQAEAVLHFI